MDDTSSAAPSAGPRRPNARGQGERLREEIISAAVQMLGDLADDEALSLRAVARAVSISPTSVYLYFPDRDALVAAAMQRCHAEMVQAADEAEAAHQDPALALRARILAQAAWVQEHPGLYKVMHESKVGMPFKEVLFTRTTAAVQRCMDAGVAPPGDAATVALDLRTAVIGMLSLRINEPDLPWPPFPEQADRFLSKLVGLAPRQTRAGLDPCAAAADAGSFRAAQVTPGGRELPDADVAAGLLGCHADGLGEGREGELHLGELLDVHASTHRGRHHLDGFGRVLTEHMGAQDRVAAPVSDQLAEPAGPAVGHRPDQVVVPGNAHGDVVTCGGLLLGQADPAILGVGEAAAGHHIVSGLAGWAVDGVPCRDASFEPGTLDEL